MPLSPSSSGKRLLVGGPILEARIFLTVDGSRSSKDVAPSQTGGTSTFQRSGIIPNFTVHLDSGTQIRGLGRATIPAMDRIAPRHSRWLEAIIVIWIVAAQFWYYSRFAEQFKVVLAPILRKLWR